MSFLSFAVTCWTSWGGWFGNLAVAVGAGVLGRESYCERTGWRRWLEIVCFGWVIVIVDWVCWKFGLSAYWSLSLSFRLFQVFWLIFLPWSLVKNLDAIILIFHRFRQHRSSLAPKRTDLYLLTRIWSLRPCFYLLLALQYTSAYRIASFLAAHIIISRHRSSRVHLCPGILLIVIYTTLHMCKLLRHRNSRDRPSCQLLWYLHWSFRCRRNPQPSLISFSSLLGKPFLLFLLCLFGFFLFIGLFFNGFISI